MTNKPLVSIIMPAYRVTQLTHAAIESVKNITSYPNFELIVMSTNGSFAQNVNAGVKAAKGKYICLFNDDMLVIKETSDWLTRLVEILEADIKSELAGISPRMLFPSGKCQFGGMIFHGDSNRKYEAGHYGWSWEGNDPRILRPRTFQATTFGCVLLRGELIRQYPLDEKYIVGGFEDVDWCLDAGLDGLKFGYVPSSVVYHFESQTFRSMPPDKQSEAFIKNRAYYHSKWDKHFANGTFKIDDIELDGGTQ